MSDLRCEMRCRCGSTAVFEVPMGFGGTFNDQISAWLKQHKDCPHATVPVLPPTGDTPAVLECEHQWYSDTSGTRCAKCGLVSSSGAVVVVDVREFRGF